MKREAHTIALSVRDYECDLEGIVNNSVYLNYLEHARHEFLKTSGTSFAALHARGIDPVVVRIEIDYLTSLVPGDVFTVHTRMRKRGRLRFVFEQRIIRDRDAAAVTNAVVTGTFLANGRPVPVPPELEQAITSLTGDAGDGATDAS
jgi:acyl-CoA thioester hydrolase